MSHSFDAPNGTTFVYEPDLSGEVEITPESGPPYMVNGPDLAAFINHVLTGYIERKADHGGLKLPPEVSVDNAAGIMRRLSDEQRMDVMRQFCRECGNSNPRCQCWNDE